MYTPVSRYSPVRAQQSGRTSPVPTGTGKPARAFFDQAVDSLGLPADRVMMIGDDAASDVQGALDAGLQGCLVKTGKYRPGDEDGIRGTFWLEADIGGAVARVLGKGATRH